MPALQEICTAALGTTIGDMDNMEGWVLGADGARNFSTCDIAATYLCRETGDETAGNHVSMLNFLSAEYGITL